MDLIAPAELIRFAREALGTGADAPVRLAPLGGRGSDRTFYRVSRDNGETAILIHYDPGRTENAYYADIATFLRRIGVAVPDLLRHDPDRFLVAVEDLGDRDLWSLRESPWEERERLYRETLAVVRRLHAYPVGQLSAEGLRLMEGFGPGLYRWEREYFREHFVGSVCGIEPDGAFGSALEAELSRMADDVAATPPALVHRDLQSQNVMVRRGEPYLIDFQGMRQGSLFYDLGSLLCDPYIDFPEGEPAGLLSYYFGLSETGMEWQAFLDLFRKASVQRLMQALGAYGFLGLTKGLKGFLGHIPAGLTNLERAASEAGSLPLLLDLCRRCRSALEREGALPAPPLRDAPGSF